MSRSNSTHDLSRLMKFAEREPWGEVMDDMEPDGANLVNDYLKRRGWNEKAPNKAYMRALRDGVMSLYEVSDVVSGRSMTLRDLLRDTPPVTVHEQNATQTLVNWDKISTRVVEVNGRRGISGALLAFSPEGAKRIAETYSLLLDESGNEAGPDPTDPEMLLRASAPMFTNIWLLDSLGQLMASEEPEMVNADGDDLVFHRIIFPLAKNVQVKTVTRMLNAAEWLSPASDNFWNWLAPAASSRKVGSTGKQALLTTMDDGAPVFANIELEGRKLIVEVNSAARAQHCLRSAAQLEVSCTVLHVDDAPDQGLHRQRRYPRGDRQSFVGAEQDVAFDHHPWRQPTDLAAVGQVDIGEEIGAAGQCGHGLDALLAAPLQGCVGVDGARCALLAVPLQPPVVGLAFDAQPRQ